MGKMIEDIDSFDLLLLAFLAVCRSVHRVSE